MDFYNRDGVGPFFEAVDVVPDGEAVLAVEGTSGGTGAGFTGMRIVDIQVVGDRVRVGRGTFENGLLTAAELVWTTLYAISDIEHGIPGDGVARYYKEPTFVDDVLTTMHTYDSIAKNALYFTITYTYTDDLLTKVITDHLNGLTFNVNIVFNAGVFAGKSFAIA